MKLIITQKNLTCCNGNAPCIYDLPKVHKSNIPLRPIVSNVDTLTYNLSKYLSNSLSEIIENAKFSVKN